MNLSQPYLQMLHRYPGLQLHQAFHFGFKGILS